MSSQAGISACRAVSSVSGGHDSQLLLPSQDLLAQRIPALVEAALVLVRPLRRNVMRGVRRPRGEVHEERLVGHERLLLARPLDRLVGHVLGEVVALLGRLLRLQRRRALVDGRVVLVRLTADEAVEVLEAAAGRPGVERSHRARLPDRHLVALAELRRRIAVQLQGLRQGRTGVGADRVVAGCRGRELGDDPHPNRVVVAAGQQGSPRGRAERRRVEAVVLQAVPGQPLSRRRRARPAEGARRGEADVVEQDDKHVRRAGRRPQRLDRRERRVRVLGVVREASLRTACPGSAGRRVKSDRSLFSSSPRNASALALIASRIAGGSRPAALGRSRGLPDCRGLIFGELPQRLSAQRLDGDGGRGGEEGDAE